MGRLDAGEGSQWHPCRSRCRRDRDPSAACAGGRYHAQPRALTGAALTAVEEITDATRDSSAWRGFAWAMTRDLRLAIRSKAELGVALLFYVIVVTLFPLAVGAET